MTVTSEEIAESVRLSISKEMAEGVEDFRRDAMRFRYLQNIEPLKAQAFFWNYTSRRQRKKAIDQAMKEEAVK